MSDSLVSSHEVAGIVIFMALSAMIGSGTGKLYFVAADWHIILMP